MAKLSKADLAARVASKLGLAGDQVSGIVDASVELIMEQLVEGNEVELEGFAAFKVDEQKARAVRDSRTGTQVIMPSRKVVSFRPVPEFDETVQKTKTSAIILAVPKRDAFARVIEFHFSQAGWEVKTFSTVEEALKALDAGGTYLVIVDSNLEDSDRLCREIKCRKGTSLIPIINLYPRGINVEQVDGFRVCGDDYVVEPFEVKKLLILAETELARSSEEEVIFGQSVRFQLPTTESEIEKAYDLCVRLFEDSDLDEEGQAAFAAAFREAVTNAAQHGNKYQPEKSIEVLYLLDKEKVTIVVHDQGEGFNPELYLRSAEEKDAVAMAQKRLSEGRVGGLGIMLMSRTADRLEYNETGNMVTLTKYISLPLPLPEE